MAERFYCPDLGNGASTQLLGDEARHLARVRRIRRGESVILFNGSGVECVATVSEIAKDQVVLSVRERRNVVRELPIAVTLACAPAKGDRLRWLIEKATELGVGRFVPILPERASEQARALRSQRAERWVVEASKQCGRNVLMEVGEPMEWERFLSEVPNDELRIVASPEGVAAAGFDFSAANRLTVAVGPEGGFTAQESRAALDRGWLPVSLGARTLRVETAAVALAALVSAAAERLRGHT